MSRGSCCQPVVPVWDMDSMGTGRGHRATCSGLCCRLERRVGSVSQGSCFYFQRLGWVTLSGGNSGSARGCEHTWGRGWGHPERPLERWADCGHQLLSQITLIKCPEEERPWKHPFLTTTPKISLPVSAAHLYFSASHGLSLMASHGHQGPGPR